MNIQHVTIGLLAILCGSAQAAEPEAVTAYLQELDKVEQAAQPLSLEPLFKHAIEAQDALMKIDGEFKEGDLAYLEALPEEEYAALKLKLRGIAVAREATVYAQPDPVFLLKLAQAHGRAADQAFFQRYYDYWGGARLFPVYMKPYADVTGCVRYGEGTLIELYEDWLRFAHDFPGTYTTAAQQTLKDLEDTVGLGTCACGGEASAQDVVRELRGFIRRYPQSPAVADARKRAQEVASGHMELPLGCR